MKRRPHANILVPLVEAMYAQKICRVLHLLRVLINKTTSVGLTSLKRVQPAVSLVRVDCLVTVPVMTGASLLQNATKMIPLTRNVGLLSKMLLGNVPSHVGHRTSAQVENHVSQPHHAKFLI